MRYEERERRVPEDVVLVLVSSRGADSGLRELQLLERALDEQRLGEVQREEHSQLRPARGQQLRAVCGDRVPQMRQQCVKRSPVEEYLNFTRTISKYTQEYSSKKSQVEPQRSGLGIVAARWRTLRTTSW